jgi:hypothetical protein
LYDTFEGGLVVSVTIREDEDGNLLAIGGVVTVADGLQMDDNGLEDTLAL